MTSDFGGRFDLREEGFSHGEFRARLLLPASPEELIDETEFEADERLPYWAELWPSARALARWVLDEPDLPSAAIELGCGVGLPALALAWRGVEAVASDYYRDALLFAEENARHNAFPSPRTLLLDWREPLAKLPRYPLIVASDVLYEARNGPALLEIFSRLLAPEGRVIIADPDRTHLPVFLAAAETAGWKVSALPDRHEDAPAGNGQLTRIRLFTLRAG